MLMKMKAQRLLGLAIQLTGILILIMSVCVAFFWLDCASTADKMYRSIIMEYFASEPGFGTNFPSGAEFSTSWTISNWCTNRAVKLKPMFVETNVPPDCRHASYRLVMNDTKILTWGFYEATLIGLNGEVVRFPALGPQSGTHMKWRWPMVPLAFSIGLITCGMKMKKSVQQSVSGY